MVEAKRFETSDFPITSDYEKLVQIAEKKNRNCQLREVRQVAPALHRIARLRGRIPQKEDISDILYDLNSFNGAQIDFEGFMKRIKFFLSAETIYYKLAENTAIKNVKDFGFHESLDDFVDVAKDTVTRIVWINWKPENGEDFLDLHKKIVSTLRKYLVYLWKRSNMAKPYSCFEDGQIEKGTPFQDISSHSPKDRPIHRLRERTLHLPLPAIIAEVEKASYIERVAGLATMKYYPSKNGLESVAKDVGVKRDTLSNALDRLLDKMSIKNSYITPYKAIAEIVSDTMKKKVLKYPSGKNVEFDSPRARLSEIPNLRSNSAYLNLTPDEQQIIDLGCMNQEGKLIYDSVGISNVVGQSTSTVCRIIDRFVISHSHASIVNNET